ncbi:outer membrane protein TOM13-domain-containing protein [Sphaerosporella brunnea]|uniref:Outer membrane protein TOM13-domain-containing protein n=1 Tax=Sphaerosporella brunnea TaxID=1250544 RepID=A0A5J5EX16_9PEZI|nr:outer membrane protein TOM13-domain-containing protein [Sphaerosporella brunnea]
MSASPASPPREEEEEEQANERAEFPVTYRSPTALTFLRTAAINLILPFINGLMLGFGELFAHELAFRWGWGTTRVFPAHRLERRREIGPGVEVRERRNGGSGKEGFSGAGGLEDLSAE